MDFDRTAEYVNTTLKKREKDRKTIWVIFWVLLGITTVEVSLGLFYKQLGLAWPFVKWTFIVLHFS